MKGLRSQVMEIRTGLKENRKITGQKTIFSDVLANEQVGLKKRLSDT